MVKYYFVAFMLLCSIVLCELLRYSQAARIKQEFRRGLVLYLPFDGDYYDNSWGGHTTSAVGSVSFTTNRFGEANSAISLTSAGSYVSVANSQYLTVGVGDYTIAAWVYFTVAQPSRIFSHGSSACAVKGYQLRTSPTLQLHQEITCNSGICPNSISTTEMSLNTWYFVTNTVTRGGTSVVYINSINSGSISGTLTCDISANLDVRV